MIDRKQTEYVANLARLALTETEIDVFTEQLNGILTYFEQLNQLDSELEGVEPTTRAIEGANVTRPDVVDPTPDPEVLLNCAPAREDTFLRVPKIMG